tara:strand:- start:103 stop:417 length:315 start_codon:yes stop_codon:yes gene_type:complete
MNRTLGDMLKEDMYKYKCELAVYQMAIERIRSVHYFGTTNEILLSSAINIRDKHIETYNAIMAGQSVTDFDDVSTLKFIEIYDNLVVKYGGQSRNPHQPEGEHT